MSGKIALLQADCSRLADQRQSGHQWLHNVCLAAELAVEMWLSLSVLYIVQANPLHHVTYTCPSVCLGLAIV